MKKILVAEDDLASRELVVEVLGGWGYQVIEAGNGREALESISRMEPDLVLLDLQMPGVDGVGVLHQLRQDPRFARLPAVALTAYAMQGDREKALAAGFDAYVAKPVDTRLLRAEIERLLR